MGTHDDLGEPEIFYSLLESARGRDIATEAAQAVAQWALERFPVAYLIGTVALDNIALQRVLEKCGFRFLEVKELQVHCLTNSALSGITAKPAEEDMDPVLDQTRNFLRGARFAWAV